MGQVPNSHSSAKRRAFPYLLMGSGRLATHLAHYLTQLNVNFLRWSRRHSSLDQLHELLPEAEKVLLAISDDSLSECVQSLNLEEGQKVIHFSGATEVSGAISCHPLASFPKPLFELKTYKEIHFAVAEGFSLNALFPEFENPWYTVSEEQRQSYHAQCVLAVSATSVVWKGLYEFFSWQDWPKEAVDTYLATVLNNVNLEAGRGATGPLVRGDQKTIESNVKALKGTPQEQLYLAVKQIIEEGIRGRS